MLAGKCLRRSADNIDNELRVKSRLIMEDMEAHGYKNIGILKFQVKKGATPPSLTAGKLNSVMATRLENALIMSDKADNPVGLTRGASDVAAAKDPKATFLTPEGRQKLFTYQYPLAWGTDNVSVDCFLTGVVDITPDMKKTKIVVNAFDQKNPGLREVLTFTVDTDLSILRDTNQSFVVARRSFNAWANAEDPDEELNKIAVKEAVKVNQPGSTGKMSVDEMKDYLNFQVLFNGQPVDITSDGQLSKPAAGQTVLIKMTAKVKLGVLLRVNGINTLNDQRDEKPNLTDYNWWVLEPNTEYQIRGYYNKGQVKTFVAKADSEVDPGADLGDKSDRHGKIDIDIFMDPTSVAKAATPKTRKPDFSFRTVNTRAATFGELKSQIQKSMQVGNGPAPARTFIVGGAVENQTLAKTTFDGRHVGGLTITYGRK